MTTSNASTSLIPAGRVTVLGHFTPDDRFVDPMQHAGMLAAGSYLRRKDQERAQRREQWQLGFVAGVIALLAIVACGGVL